MVRLWRRWRKIPQQQRHHVTLVIVVGAMLLAVIIANEMGLRNHP